MSASSRRERVALELLRVRDLAGISGRAMAGRLGVTQATIWRYDHARTLPSLPQIRTWLDSCNVSPEDRQRILDLAEAAHGETRSWRHLLADTPHLQEQFRQQESDADLVCNIQCVVIPSLLQTPEYAAHLLPLADITGGVEHRADLAARMQRQAALYDERPRFRFILAERVLSWSPGPAELMAPQRNRITSVAALRSVELAVLPERQAVAVPWHPFILWYPGAGPPYVTAELVHGSQQLDDPADVAIYERLWQRMWQTAAVGDEAIELIRKAGDSGGPVKP